MTVDPFERRGVKSRFKYKKCLINIFILVLAVVLMLALAEVTMRWLDGYQMSQLELEQDPNRNKSRRNARETCSSASNET